jgi:2,3-bisphosphoglycerate-dependent phosphoglycerate mutase
VLAARSGSQHASGVGIEIVFETHSLSTDNDAGIATGWNDGQLSERGRELARELGQRRRDDGLAAVFTSDLGRAVETAHLAFEGAHLPILHDWRLRECDYGEGNGMSAALLHARKPEFLDTPYPGGESWRQAVTRVGRFLDDLQLRWTGERVLVIGHVATRWALDHFINGEALEELIAAEFAWKEGWEYRLRALHVQS